MARSQKRLEDAVEIKSVIWFIRKYSVKRY